MFQQVGFQPSQDRAKATLNQSRAEMDARIRILQDQAKRANDRAKERIEKRVAEVRADFDIRSKKLKQAWSLAKKARAA
jgi:hypothetical protein